MFCFLDVNQRVIHPQHREEQQRRNKKEELNKMTCVELWSGWDKHFLVFLKKFLDLILVDSTGYVTNKASKPIRILKNLNLHKKAKFLILSFVLDLI